MPSLKVMHHTTDKTLDYIAVRSSGEIVKRIRNLKILTMGSFYVILRKDRQCRGHWDPQPYINLLKPGGFFTYHQV
jgi:hypothetical protein